MWCFLLLKDGNKLHDEKKEKEKQEKKSNCTEMSPVTTGCGCKWNIKYRSANLIHSPISLIYCVCSQLFTLLVSTYKGNSDLTNVRACSLVFSAFTWIPFLSRSSKWSKEERERKKHPMRDDNILHGEPHLRCADCNMLRKGSAHHNLLWMCLQPSVHGEPKVSQISMERRKEIHILYCSKQVN